MSSGRLSPSSSRPPTPTRTTPGQAHIPVAPSTLRTSHVPDGSPEDTRASQHRDSEGNHLPETGQRGIYPTTPDYASAASEDVDSDVAGQAEPGIQPDVRTRLLDQSQWDKASGCGSDDCSHGTMTPRPGLSHGYGSMDTFSSGQSHDGFGGLTRGDTAREDGNGVIDESSHQKMSMTGWLAKKHGVKSPNLMFVVSERSCRDHYADPN